MRYPRRLRGINGVVALWLRGLPFSISAAVGSVAVSGLAVLSDMVLASTIRPTLEESVAVRAAIRAAAME